MTFSYLLILHLVVCVSLSWRLLFGLLISSSAACLASLLAQPVDHVRALCRIALSGGLLASAVDIWRTAGSVDASRPGEVYKYYIHVWDIFYICYFLLPLLR